VSALRAAAGEYLAMRRALGFKLVTQGQHLMSFIRFCEERGAGRVTADLAIEWATRTSRGSGNEVYQARRLDVVRIFARLGIPAIAVEASSGNMGGSDSVEFMCPTPAGEDLVARCPECDYAANLEKATSALAPVTVTVEEVNGDGVGVTNSFEAPEAVTVSTTAIEKFTSGATYTFPAHSLTVLTFRAERD